MDTHNRNRARTQAIEDRLNRRTVEKPFWDEGSPWPHHLDNLTMEGRAIKEEREALLKEFAEAQPKRRNIFAPDPFARTLRLFAADCAAHALPIYEQAYPGDDRPRNAVEALRRYADDVCPETYDAMTAAQALARVALDEVVDAVEYGFPHRTPMNIVHTIQATIEDPLPEPLVRAVTWHAALAVGYACTGINREQHDSVNAELRWQVERLRAYLAGEVV